MKSNTTAKKNRGAKSIGPESGARASVLTTLPEVEREEWQVRQAVMDPVTGFSAVPALKIDLNMLFDIYPCLGVVYLQLGKFSGMESAYGWEIFDEILGVAANTLREWNQTGEWKERVLSMHFNGVDGFFLLVNINDLKTETPHLLLELLGHQLRDLLHDALAQQLGRNVIDMLEVLHSSMKLNFDPQARVSRQLYRAFKETTRAVGRTESKGQNALEQEFRNIIAHRSVRTVFQPIFHLPKQQRVGYEALTRGPEGSIFENPETLFTAARDNSLLMELESICQASAFDSLVTFKPEGRIFLNTSSNFISHPLFRKRLKESALKKLAPSLVLEITEKEAIQNYHDFRNDLEPIRKSGIRIAVDDAGSGYADLESIAEVRPEYIKIANSITRNISRDLIKQEIISSFLTLARKLKATVIAEGIETREDFHILKGLGVEYGQGYFLGRPAMLAGTT